MRAAVIAGCLAVALVAPLGCKKKAVVSATTPPTAAPTAAPAGGGNTNYVPGGGAVQNVRQAAKRTIALNDLKNLGLLIESAYTDAGNKMPMTNDIKAAVAKESPTLKAAIDDGSIILCWTAAHDGLWAYEIDADTKGGLALVSGNARRCDADEIKQLLGRK